MVQRYTPVRRARHGKRLPQALDDPDHITHPVTITVTEVRQPSSSQDSPSAVTPTVTVFVSPAATFLSSSGTLPAPIPTLAPETTAISSSLVPRPTPSVVVNNGANNNNGVSNAGDKANNREQSSAASSSGTPTGAIIGIVLAIVLLVSAALVFWFRRRAVANRLKMRAWTTSKSSTPSFLWIEPPKENKGRSPSPAQGPDLQPNRGPPQPPMAYGPSWNGLPYIPPPPPPPAPRAAGINDYPASPSVSIAPSVPSVLTPAGAGGGRMLIPRVPPPSSTPSTPGTSKPVESAKVRTAFIPTLSDELLISPGEFIRLHEEYDDGWALCSNARGEMGMVPLECLDRVGMTPNTRREFQKLARVSSLHAKSFSSYQ